LSTIPASQIVNVIPNVLSAGGSALVLNGLFLTKNSRVPIGQVLSFPNDGVSVAKYFGASSHEVDEANVYFAGFNGSTQKPATLLFTQYNVAAVPAYLRGGPVNQLTIPQLQGLSGSLTVLVDGYARSAPSVTLSAATSYSAAAALIQTGLNATPVSAASVTGAIASATASVTGSIAGNILTVTAITSGTLVGGAIIAGTGITAGTQITSQLSGTTGGVGTYAVSVSQTVVSGTVTAGYGILTVTAVTSGTLSVGQTLSGAGITVGTQITSLGTGTGLTGTYNVQTSQTAASGTVTASSTPVVVSYDSVSGGFIISSGIVGSSSTIAYVTGTLADALYLSAATGAVVSQGAYAATPAVFMTGITQITQNWATFMTLFDPDGGVGSVQKQAFANWNNTQNQRYAYVAWDLDISPTLSNNATSSLGNILQASAVSGTIVVYETGDQHIAALTCGVAASPDFNATNGRATLAFRGQAGLVAGVTNATVANNLIANGYNFYGAYATANQLFLEYQPGQVTGKFQWADSYVNQIWFSNQLQLALMVLLQNVNSVPYNQAGYDLIKAACADPINQALNYGAMRQGVTLSKAQAAEINAAAGRKVDDVLQQQGWYLQVLDASPQSRQARTTPPINLWYMDGQSVQQITLNSVLVQ